MYLELHTSSAFSFLDGASLPGAIVTRAAELGYPAVALLDRDGLYGAPQFYRAAKAAGIKAIVGAELTIGAIVGRAETSNFEVRTTKLTPHPTPWVLSVLVATSEGYRNLCRVITRAKLRAPKGSPISRSMISRVIRPASSRSPAGRRTKPGDTASAVASIG